MQSRHSHALTAIVFSLLGVGVAFGVRSMTPEPGPMNASIDAPQAFEGAERVAPDFVPPRELMRRHLEGWQRPEGPIKIAIQAGHWKAEDAPDEQDGLRTNGAEAAGKEEWEITLAIAERTVALLKERGYEAELLPTVVPPQYLADVFVSVHADEAPNRLVGGYRTAASWLDLSGTSGSLAEAIDAAYGEATGMENYPEITDGMLQYYAFNWLLYEHSLHPMTPAVIIETGYMTNVNDRKTIFNRPDLAAKGIADGVAAYLTAQAPAAK